MKKWEHICDARMYRGSRGHPSKKRTKAFVSYVINERKKHCALYAHWERCGEKKKPLCSSYRMLEGV